MLRKLLAALLISSTFSLDAHATEPARRAADKPATTVLVLDGPSAPLFSLMNSTTSLVSFKEGVSKLLHGKKKSEAANQSGPAAAQDAPNVKACRPNNDVVVSLVKGNYPPEYTIDSDIWLENKTSRNLVVQIEWTQHVGGKGSKLVTRIQSFDCLARSKSATIIFGHTARITKCTWNS